MIRKCILEKDPQLQIEPEDFSEAADSIKLLRERVPGTKLEGSFEKMKGNVVNESEHTITVLPKSGKPVMMSKINVAKVKEGMKTEQSGSGKEKDNLAGNGKWRMFGPNRHTRSTRTFI